MNPPDDRVTEVIHRAMIHPIRRRILLILRNKEMPMSPVDMAPLIEGEPGQKKLSKISYHARQLQEAGLVSLFGTEPRRGTVKHLYGLSALFTADILDALALDRIAELLEDEATETTEGVLSEIMEILAASGRPIKPECGGGS
jgi:DNA-binding transcriptional ArsR family regulator